MLRRSVLLLALQRASALTPSDRVVSRGLAMMARKKPRTLPIISPEAFERRRLFRMEGLTKICQSLRSAERVRITEDPVMEALCTRNEERLLLGDELFPDVLFIRSCYEELFQTIRMNHHVILTGSPGISKSV